MPRSGCQPKPPRKVGVPSVTGQVGIQVQNDGKDGNPSTGPVFSPQKKQEIRTYQDLNKDIKGMS